MRAHRSTDLEDPSTSTLIPALKGATQALIPVSIIATDLEELGDFSDRNGETFRPS